MMETPIVSARTARTASPLFEPHRETLSAVPCLVHLDHAEPNSSVAQSVGRHLATGGRGESGAVAPPHRPFVFVDAGPTHEQIARGRAGEHLQAVVVPEA